MTTNSRLNETKEEALEEEEQDDMKAKFSSAETSQLKNKTRPLVRKISPSIKMRKLTLL